MKVLIVGGGGREHALAWKLTQSSKLSKIYCAPGNAGISRLADCIVMAADDIESLSNFARKERIDLTVVGPEGPLVKGITDRFQSNGLKVFGPSRKADLHSCSRSAGITSSTSPSTSAAWLVT